MGFEFVQPDSEQMTKVMQIQRQLQFKGGRKDVDKKVEDMDEEEKAVFNCLEDDQNVFAGAYEELDDDFLLMLNDGKPALEPVRREFLQPQKEEQPPEYDEDEGMIPNYKERMAHVIAMLDKQNEIRKVQASTKQEKKVIEAEAKAAVNQRDLDEVFNAFLGKEYTDDQIGDLEGDQDLN